MNENPYSETGASNDVSHPRQSFAGCVLNLLALMLVLSAIALVGLVLLLPLTRRGGEPAYRSQCKHNLKLIGLALHN